MNAIIIQPPLVQLNAPYPSGAYLQSFFKSSGHSAVWLDLSIQLVHSLFSAEGIAQLFSITKEKALALASRAKREGDMSTCKNVRTYILQSELWISWIDFIMALLCGKEQPGTRELCHRFVFSAHSPRGSRMNRYIEHLDHALSADDARNLASLALEDIADYISFVFDKEFSLVRYAEQAVSGETDFRQIEKSAESPVLKTFYSKVLDSSFSHFPMKESGRTLVCISVPFAGTFAAALCTAAYLKKTFGNSVFIVFGGGFVNTELRDFSDPAFSKYADAISYDRGYGSYQNLFDLLHIHNGKIPENHRLYKMRLFTGGTVTEPNFFDAQYERLENELTASLVPDYSDIDFSLYPRVADDTNPMQRLWSDGAWIKAYLAHGCYWHRCSFCDVTLDYVASYKMTQVETLFKGLKKQAEQKGIYGIHFVDEAMPPSALRKFSMLNACAGTPFSYWGNIRFEKTYSRDLADFLAFGGLTGVSGGIEIATSSGLDSISKGTDLDSIVGACCAFKEAGILVHAYMIYGYFKETDQDTVNSMETLRQLFCAGLLDSCFWHKFVLTRHSRIYAEWKQGLHKDLHPSEPKHSGMFAQNTLHFNGEEKTQKFAEGLSASVQSWMHGRNLNRPVGQWFRFKLPLPSVPADFVEKSVMRYEQRRTAEWNSSLEFEKLWWLAGTVIFSKGKLIWNYMQEEFIQPVSEKFVQNFQMEFEAALYALSPAHRNIQLMKSMAENHRETTVILKNMRGKGLVMA